MDANQAVVAHSTWKSKLANYIKDPNHSLTAAEVEASDRCDLGKWLKGEGRKHASLQEYSKLVAEHARFHRAAASVVRNADKHNVQADMALGSKSEFGEASASVVLAIMAMKDKF